MKRFVEGIIFAQFIPECERALRVFVNEKARSRCRCTWAAKCAANVLLPEPPLRDANASTFMNALQSRFGSAS